MSNTSFIQPPSGWTLVPHDGYVSMSPPSDDAELRVTPVDLTAARIDPSQWLASVMRANRKIGRVLTPVEYGSFTGYALEVVALGTRLRAWFLRAGALPLVVAYRCATAVGGRDDATVAAALNTLTPVDAPV